MKKKLNKEISGTWSCSDNDGEHGGMLIEAG